MNYSETSKAKEKLNWEPATSHNELISEMIDEDLREAKKALLKKRVSQS